MGVYDRDYYRNSSEPGALASVRMWSVTTWLIAINVAVYVLNLLTDRELSGLGAFTAYAAVEHLQVWRFITFQFLHASPSHLFFNMLSLYFFGPMVEQYLGQRRYLAFYLLCGAAGAALYLLLMFIGVMHETPLTPLVGASAGIFGILIAAATRIAPNTTVMLMFPPIPMRLKTLAWILLGIAVLTVFEKVRQRRRRSGPPRRRGAGICPHPAPASSEYF